MPTDPIDWIALNRLPGVGPILLGRAIQRFRDPGLIAFRLSPAGWRTVPGMRGDVIDGIVAARQGLRRAAEEELAAATRIGARPVPRGDPSYPAALAMIHDPPVLLWAIGRLAETAVRIAVVGSRRATHYGRSVARGLGSGLAARDVEVVSGGARGVDTEAHKGALDVEGRTVAVVGSGLLNPYPRENEKLFARIAEQGAVISELPLETHPAPSHFPRRNRLISGLSAGVVVVEAAPRSGSLSTAHHALDQGREVMAVPGMVTTEQAQGCHRLIQQGAKLVQRVEDVIEELSPMYTAGLPPAASLTAAGGDANEAKLEADEKAVLALLREAGRPVPGGRFG